MATLPHWLLQVQEERVRGGGGSAASLLLQSSSCRTILCHSLYWVVDWSNVFWCKWQTWHDAYMMRKVVGTRQSWWKSFAPQKANESKIQPVTANHLEEGVKLLTWRDLQPWSVTDHWEDQKCCDYFLFYKNYIQSSKVTRFMWFFDTTWDRFTQEVSG